jgi:hypothetical protein
LNSVQALMIGPRKGHARLPVEEVLTRMRILTKMPEMSWKRTGRQGSRLRRKFKLIWPVIVEQKDANSLF